MQQTVHAVAGTHILQYLQLHMLLGICQLKRQAAHKLADRRIIDGMHHSIHSALVQHAERLHLELEQEKLLVNHPPPSLLAFPGILGLMNRDNCPFARHEIIFPYDHLRQNLRD
ncbi:hypothetical protein D3C87_1875760 [compost metagenome]